ncbi:MAG: hypothetical protein E7158_06805 [Firmicutes bacterium]|nr:hypothetical protein [Bacillota bacterium]
MRKMSYERYMVHDELLFELYNLKLDTVQYQVINGQPYLVNIAKKRKFEIGFRIKISKILDSNIENDTYLKELGAKLSGTEIDGDELHMKLLEKYGKFLCLSNFEKYMLNVLLDKYLCNYHSATITLKEIETEYRHKCMDKRYISLNDDTFNKYVKTLDLLADKELYLKTTSGFRKSCYGCNDIITTQDLLYINNYLYEDKNRLEISYSLGLFGKVIRDCKRYSVIAPAKYFNVNINQAKKNLVAMYLSRMLYVEQGIKRSSIEYKFMFRVDLDDVLKFVDDPLTPITSNYNRHKDSIRKLICGYLLDLKNIGRIYDYDVKVVNNIPERKTKEEKEREQWFKELAYYWGEKEPKFKVSKHTEIIVYISEPTFEYFAKLMERDAIYEDM